VQHWLFTIGVGKVSPPLSWWVDWEHHRTEMWFPWTKRPISIDAGDRALLNGSQRRGLLAAVEVVSHEPEPNETEDDEARERWPWKVRYRLIAAKCADSNLASLEDAGVSPRSTQRQPHIRITPDQYRAGVESLARAIVRSAS
jgi:hypothetical protein